MNNSSRLLYNRIPILVSVSTLFNQHMLLELIVSTITSEHQKILTKEYAK
ncbi:unnamed protein product [Paramecium octaurelia]|uniref:Uncharacterized protein n=1 Tax=Paramecium octaurelia TaxID=43137 RepID=A0A8S1V6D3_PAROT|nr:unnamed protein product [Paramecium octaurelia]